MLKRKRLRKKANRSKKKKSQQQMLKKNLRIASKTRPNMRANRKGSKEVSKKKKMMRL